ncbi:MAG: M48 family metallopeptidase [Rhodospirillales bacterium]|nr:M48 family metallopeptidase [Rhodospirillales bacterium]
MIPLLKQLQPTEADILALSPHLAIRRSKRARRMALRMDSAGRTMVLVLPERASLAKAYDFTRKHSAWIESKISALPVSIPFRPGAIIPLLGKERLLVEHEGRDFVLEDTCLRVPPGRASFETRVRRYLKEEARQTLTALAHEKAEETRKTVKGVQVRDTKSRWGSCGPDGQLSFSWRLIFAPWESLDYVVAHEVAHLSHMNHSKAFWDVCAALSTDYKAGKKWIRDHGHDLMRYGRKNSTDKS